MNGSPGTSPSCVIGVCVIGVVDGVVAADGKLMVSIDCLDGHGLVAFLFLNNFKH